MLGAALFIIAPNGKQPRCPSASEGTNYGTCIKWKEYYSAVQGNKVWIQTP